MKKECEFLNAFLILIFEGLKDNLDDLIRRSADARDNEVPINNSWNFSE